jgi:hypothetical protein
VSRRNATIAVLLAALLVLAGCTGGPGGADPAGSTPDDGLAADASGTVQFYVSDAPNAIGEFEHLNVTITTVGLHRVGDGDTPAPTSAPNETVTATATPETPEDTDTPETPDTPETDDGDDEDDGESEGWVEYETNRTVDLTRLVGDNATSLGALQAPAGEYDKVFVYVSDINATLENGESVNVKLPSEKLQINKRFTVGNGSNVSFVFDISVFKAGNSGKYILKPVVSESGADREVRDVDEDDREADDEDDADETDDDADEEAGDLTAEFVGPVRPGEDATVKVTGDDGPLEGANVSVNGEAVGPTDAEGEVTFAVPEDTEELSVTVTDGDREAELEREFEDRGGAALAPAPA